MYALKQTVAPTADPISRDDVKDFLGVAHKYDDAMIDTMIKAATYRIEERTNRQLITATWQLTLDVFPVGEFICLPKPPIQSVTTIAYTDADGNAQTFTDYTLDIEKEPGEIFRTASWPATDAIPSAVKITYVAGYGATASTIPEGLNIALRYAVKHLYDRRDEVGTVVSSVPQTTESIIDSFKFGDEFVNYG